jgi:hypothetical protein
MNLINFNQIEKKDNIIYLNFWNGFNEATDNKLKKIFTYLFSQIDNDIIIFSVFGDPGLLNKHIKPNNIIVSFSGENFSIILKDKNDINLVMESRQQNVNIIPMHLFSITAYERDAWPILLKKRTSKRIPMKFCAFVAGNGNNKIRNRFYQLLNNQKTVDSAGGYMNSIGYSAPREDKDYWTFLSDYKFNICFENNVKDEYITEKLFHAYMGGCIPIYYGSPKALEYFNKDAFLYLPDSSDESMNVLIEKILLIDSNDDEYLKIYNQPLVLNNQIPSEMNIDTWKKEIMNIFN